MRKTNKLLRTIIAILAGAFGVRSNKRMREDCEDESPYLYIAIGILFTVTFIATLLIIINFFIL